jgi:hypothetical protein
LNTNKFGQNTDTGELVFAGRTWHYDTRYFDTSIASMKRVVVRVYEGNAKAKGNPLAESTGFLGTSLAAPGTADANWNQLNVPGAPASGGTPAGGTLPTGTPQGTVGTPLTPTPVPGTNGQPPIP